MSSSGAIVGAVMAELAMAELHSAALREARQPAVFVRSLQEDEAVAFASRMDGFILPGADTPVETRVGTSREIPGLAESMRLGPSRTLTSYRNQNQAGLVLVELDPYSDAQGLAALRTLDDATVLSVDSEDLRRRRTRILVESAWRFSVRDGLREVPPQQLENRFAEVHDVLSRLGTTSLRLWVRFAHALVEAIAADPIAVQATIDQVVGKSLSALRLFPDARLFSDPQALKKRLQDNSVLSQRRTPSGKELDEDELVEMVRRLELPPELLESVELDEPTARQRMLAVAEGGSDDERAQVPFDLWLQLFLVRPDRVALGARVRSVFEDQFPERVAEFDDLGVETGLDNGEQDAAESLIRAEPPGDEPALVDLLPVSMRRRLEKLATPRAATETDPLRALLYGLQNLERSSSTDQRVVTLSREHVRPGEGDLSLAVFSFVFGPSLAEIASSSADGIGARLELDPSLCTPCDVEALKAAEEGDESKNDSASRWAPLRLVLKADGQLDPLYRFQWRPLENLGIVALVGLIVAESVPLAPKIASSLDEWLGRSTDVDLWKDPSWMPEPTEPLTGPEVGAWIEARAALRDQLLRHGIEEAALADFVDGWSEMLERARNRLVPQQSPLQELEQFLSIDTARFGASRLALLATHPLRLRWFSEHLKNMKGFVTRSLEAGIRLNVENDQLFFDWLDKVSPHRQPPFISGSSQDLAIPVRETGMHEEYALIHSGGAESRDWLSGIDDASVDAIAGVIRSYLDAYPHKRDGVSLLVLLRDGDPAVASRLLKQVRSKEHSSSRIVLHVLTGRRHHDAISGQIEELLATGNAVPETFFPDVELVLHHWADGDDDPDLTHLHEQVDVAIAPNLFGTKTSAQPSTRRRDRGLGGSFDPWIDGTTHDLGLAGGKNENVSKVLLPAQPDPVLESWSTLSVRRFRNAAVSPDADDSTDYLALQVQFHVGAPLFEELHRLAHWVVTLDPFVGRDQIDALAGRPDVILVRGGIGKNRTYTLVVSSKTGAAYVTARLAQKLDHDLQIELPCASEVLAARLYEVGRNGFPGVMLRALGLGRAAEEVIGLVVSRHVVEAEYPVPEGTSGLEWWVALDEHTDWFGGAQGSRADLLRVIAIEDGQSFSLRLHVVESKFRGSEDAAAIAIADQQLNRTIHLLSEAFGEGAGGSVDRPDDARFWVREIVDALDQTSKAVLSAQDAPALRSFGKASAERLRAALLSEEVRVDEVVGVALGIAYNASGSLPAATTASGHGLIRVSGTDLTRVLRRITFGAADEETDAERRAAVKPAPTQDRDGESDRVVPGGDEARLPGRAVLRDAPDSRETEAAGESQTAAMRGMSQAELDHRYQRMLDVFAAHGVRVSAPEEGRTDQGPGFYVLRVIPEMGVSVDKLLNRSEDLKLALRLEASQHLRAFVDRGAVVLEVPKADSERYGVSTSEMWEKAPWRSSSLYLPIGEDINGEVVGVELSSSDSPHLLIGGATGSGKSVLIESLLRAATHQYAPEELRLHLVDPKGTELVDFEGSAHLDGEIGFSGEDAAALLERAVGEMQSRYEKFKGRKVRSIADFNDLGEETFMPWWLVVLDEYADLTSDPDDKSQIERSLKRLAQKARAAGIHVVVATQKPSAEVISTTVRSNLPAQIALRVKTSSDSRIIMDEAGAESLSGKGDAFFKTAKGLVRLQCAQYDDHG